MADDAPTVEPTTDPFAGPAAPWPPEPVSEDPMPEADIDRLMIFVPAIMSVGLLFSLATLLRDVFRWTGGRSRERRTGIEAGAVVGSLLGEPEPDPEDIGILSRPAYLITAIVLVGGAAYVAIGSIANFLNDQGYVRDIGWLLAVSLGLALLLGFLGGVSLAVFGTWPNPPAWTYGPLRTAPLSVTPGRRGLSPSWALTVSTVVAALATGIITLIVGSGRSVAMDIDRPIARWLVELEWLDRLAAIDPFGGTVISLGFVVLIGVSVFRCRVMAVTYPLAFVAAWAGGSAIRELIDRPRPTQFGNFESFPSGHMVQAVFLAGLVPLALVVLLSDRRAATLSRSVLAAAVVATGLYRLHRQDHWPLDALAGVTYGLTVVLATHWVMEHRNWHRSCSSCPWSVHPSETPWRLGVFALRPSVARSIGWAGAGGALAAAGLLAVITAFIGLPTDPLGYGLGSSISGPFQLTLAALMAVAGVVAIRWKAVASVTMAFAAAGLGLFASVEYRPLLTVGLAATLMIPAVLTWLAWQPTETIGRIAALATITTVLLTSTAAGSIEIYDYYFGPTHLDSDAEELDSEADWLWLGGVDARAATVVAGGLDDGAEAVLRYWPTGGDLGAARVVPATVDDDGLARFVLADLTPATEYRYAVDELEQDEDDEDDEDDGEDGQDPRGDSGFTTFAEGPQDLVVVAGACARTGSNGAVFDAIVAEDPDLFLALGDLHYANLDSTNPSDHIREYGRALSQPGQAALFSAVPTAYVWDDHDFGPNDADSSTPGRDAVSIAYRRAVPHYGVDPDPEGTIAQAFTVGRVRFVVSDTRSHRTADWMLGPEQQAWLIDELVSASTSHAVVVWVNPTPWIGAPSPGSDSWWGYADDRQAIADALAEAEVHNLVMVSGDAHMVAIDDGTNSGYAADGSPGFPLLHAAALDRPGVVKGGPYSHGAIPGGGQYGRLEITDDGGATIGVRLSGHNWKDEELLHLELEIDVPPGARVD